MINAHIIKTKCALNVSSILQIKYFCFLIFLFKRMAKLLMASEIKAQNTDLNGSVASKSKSKSKWLVMTKSVMNYFLGNI